MSKKRTARPKAKEREFSWTKVKDVPKQEFFFLFIGVWSISSQVECTLCKRAPAHIRCIHVLVHFDQQKNERFLFLRWVRCLHVIMSFMNELKILLHDGIVFPFQFHRSIDRIRYSLCVFSITVHSRQSLVTWNLMNN